MKKIKNILLITICLFPLNVFAGSNDCVEIFEKNSQTLEYLQDIYSFLKFLVPIILLAMSVKDFVLAIAKEQADDVKKATNTLFKRIIIAVLILIIPTILNFFLKLIGYSTCTL